MGRPHKKVTKSKCPFCGAELEIIDGKHSCPNQCEKE